MPRPHPACSSKPLRLTEIWTASGLDLRVFSDARVAVTEYTLNATAALIWKLCDGKHTVTEIIREVSGAITEGHPGESTIKKETLLILSKLASRDLLTWVAPPVDVLLVVPPFPRLYVSEASQAPEYSSPPLGLMYLASALQEVGFSVKIADLHITAGHPEDIVALCRSLRPAIVGITSTTPTYPNAAAIARFVKAFDVSIVTVLGGAHASAWPAGCLRSPGFDYVCVGEGEATLIELTRRVTRGEAPKEVPRRRNERILRTGVPCTIDSLPLPARELVDIRRYYQSGALLASRGCPYRCSYCACPVVWAGGYRRRSAESVIEEVKGLISSYGLNAFDFHDDTFNLDKAWLLSLCRGLREHGPSVRWSCFCRASNFTPLVAKEMARAGCNVVQFGVESGDDGVLRSIGKSLRGRQVVEAVTAARRAGIDHIACGFMIGHATDSEASVRRTVEFGLRLRDAGATRLAVSLLTPYPGTELYRRRHEMGVRLMTRDWEQYNFSRVVVETRNLSADKLRALYSDAVARFYDASAK